MSMCFVDGVLRPACHVAICLKQSVLVEKPHVVKPLHASWAASQIHCCGTGVGQPADVQERQPWFLVYVE